MRFSERSKFSKFYFFTKSIYYTKKSQSKIHTFKHYKFVVVIENCFHFGSMTEKLIDSLGCLSIPGMTGLVKRYSKINYEGFDMKGNLIKKEAEGLHARIVQHEFDHLKGILYLNRLVDSRAFGFVNEIEEYWKNEKLL